MADIVTALCDANIIGYIGNDRLDDIIAFTRAMPGSNTVNKLALVAAFSEMYLKRENKHCNFYFVEKVCKAYKGGSKFLNDFLDNFDIIQDPEPLFYTLIHKGDTSMIEIACNRIQCPYLTPEYVLKKIGSIEGFDVLESHDIIIKDDRPFAQRSMYELLLTSRPELDKRIFMKKFFKTNPKYWPEFIEIIGHLSGYPEYNDCTIDLLSYLVANHKKQHYDNSRHHSASGSYEVQHGFVRHDRKEIPNHKW